MQIQSTKNEELNSLSLSLNSFLSAPQVYPLGNCEQTKRQRYIKNFVARLRGERPSSRSSESFLFFKRLLQATEAGAPEMIQVEQRYQRMNKDLRDAGLAIPVAELEVRESLARGPSRMRFSCSSLTEGLFVGYILISLKVVDVLFCIYPALKLGRERNEAGYRVTGAGECDVQSAELQGQASAM
jgi:hypothetical protein